MDTTWAYRAIAIAAALTMSDCLGRTELSLPGTTCVAGICTYDDRAKGDAFRSGDTVSPGDRSSANDGAKPGDGISPSDGTSPGDATTPGDSAAQNDGGPTGDAPAAGDSGLFCAANGECNEACILGYCVPFSLIGQPCDEHRDCIFDVTCRAGVCTESPASVGEKVFATGAASLDFFGIDVAISGDVFIGGAFWDDSTAGIDSGSAHVFRLMGANWIEEAILESFDNSAGAELGYTVDISNTVAVAGAAKDADNGVWAGAAYPFRFNGIAWLPDGKIKPSDGGPDELFGEQLAVDGDVIIAGAIRHDHFAADAGAAWVFRHNGVTWVEEQELRSTDILLGDAFGYAIDLEGDVAVIAAPYEDSNGNRAGAAYVFRYAAGSWTQEQKLLASDGTANDDFGRAVSISGNRIAVGAGSDDAITTSAGSAYIFELDASGSWLERQKLTASDAAFQDFFGRALELDGNTLIVGSYYDNGGYGSAYIFSYDGAQWQEVHKLTASDGQVGDEYGNRVAIDAGIVVIGAPREDDQGDRAGAVYVVDLANLP